MSKPKLGFYRKSTDSNKELIQLFEHNQKIRYESKPSDWEDKQFLKKIQLEEKHARKTILIMLKRGLIKTSDDFFRAAFFFQHSHKFQDYAIAIALYSVSSQLGEEWAKNYYAMALDRFLLSVGQDQYFGTQFEKRRGKWKISPFRENVSDEERQKYLVQSLEDLKKTVNELEQADIRDSH